MKEKTLLAAGSAAVGVLASSLASRQVPQLPLNAVAIETQEGIDVMQILLFIGSSKGEDSFWWV